MTDRVSLEEAYDNRSVIKQILKLKDKISLEGVTGIAFERREQRGIPYMHLIVTYEDGHTDDASFDINYLHGSEENYGITSEIMNEGNAVYIVSRDSEENDIVFMSIMPQTPEINIDIRDPNSDARSFFMQNQNGAYMQLNGEVGGQPRRNQKLLRADDAFIQVEGNIDTGTMEFTGSVSQANYDRLMEGRLMYIALKDNGNDYGNAFATSHYDFTDGSLYAGGYYSKVDGTDTVNIIYLTFSGLDFSGKIAVIGGGGGGGASWGSITGTLSNQTDLRNALAEKLNAAAVRTAWSGVPGDGVVPSEKLTKTALDDVNARVDAVEDELGSAGESGTIRGDISTLDHDLSTVSGVVGDSSSGLVKSVNDLGTDVGNLNTSVGSLETAVGDSSSGLVKDVGDLQTGKQNAITFGTTDPTGGNDGDIYIKYAE